MEFGKADLDHPEDFLRRQVFVDMVFEMLADQDVGVDFHGLQHALLLDRWGLDQVDNLVHDLE